MKIRSMFKHTSTKTGLKYAFFLKLKLTMSILINSNRTCLVQTTTKIAFKAKWGGGGGGNGHESKIVTAAKEYCSTANFVFTATRLMQHLQNDTAIIIEE